MASSAETTDTTSLTTAGQRIKTQTGTHRHTHTRARASSSQQTTWSHLQGSGHKLEDRVAPFKAVGEKANAELAAGRARQQRNWRVRQPSVSHLSTHNAQESMDSSLRWGNGVKTGNQAGLEAGDPLGTPRPHHQHHQPRPPGRTSKIEKWRAKDAMVWLKEIK